MFIGVIAKAQTSASTVLGASPVERFFNKRKQYRRLATRYEKTARNFLSMFNLATIVIWSA
jgi:transposase